MKKKYRKPEKLPTNINFIVDTQTTPPFFELLFLDEEGRQEHYLAWDCVVKPPNLPERHHEVVQYILHYGNYLFSLNQPHHFYIQGMQQLLERMNADQVDVTFYTTSLERIPSSRKQDIFMQIAVSRDLMIKKQIENQIREEIRNQIVRTISPQKQQLPYENLV